MSDLRCSRQRPFDQVSPAAVAPAHALDTEQVLSPRDEGLLSA